MRRKCTFRMRDPLLLGVWALGFMIFALPLCAEEKDPKAGEVTRGAKVWAENCSRCHNMRDPTEFRDDLWKPIVMHMRVRAGLTGQDTRDILAFLQASNNPARTAKPYDEKAVAAPPVITGVAGTLTGEAIYNQTCVACHGADGKGAMPGVPDLSRKDGPLAKSDEKLLKRIIEGFQSPGSPMAMPAKGGNPSLTDQDIREVLSFLRSTLGP